MLPKYHIIFSIILTIILYLLNFDFLFILLFFLASILIDIDHYFFYIIKKKNFNLGKTYKYFRYELNRARIKKPKTLLFIFHTIEFFLLLLILSLFLNFFWPIFFGCLFHDVIDIICGLFQKHKKYIKAPSLIWYITKK